MAPDTSSLAELIGTPFAYRGRGPESYDCYGLLQECYRRIRGLEIPDVASPTEFGLVSALVAGNLFKWSEVEPQPFVATLFRIKGVAAHVGFVLPSDRFIHTWEQSNGVVIERLTPWRQRIVGFYDYQ